ncbi:hypothetical protein [Actinoalloteichus fjordicus]|uniref:Uncharacterized protein n=1 Tax=Actinoalloteichus fjordicus TaxID=1612552 RepID=A0AAC9PU64_9PSEU|nr:hypothetical protein [Actinoalloteichus fjordicus]APU16626.1 hypothetical protein UA74_23040 [Actinoalloteichus fjordicus]
MTTASAGERPALITEAEALRRYPELAGLLALRRAGWSWTTDRDEDGELTALVGFRRPRGHLDALYVTTRDRPQPSA